MIGSTNLDPTWLNPSQYRQSHPCGQFWRNPTFVHQRTRPCCAWQRMQSRLTYYTNGEAKTHEAPCGMQLHDAPLVEEPSLCLRWSGLYELWYLPLAESDLLAMLVCSMDAEIVQCVLFLLPHLILQVVASCMEHSGEC
uniref:Uncharacterized protein n=1 Tax=Craspedostauros australis TaxID=1486917 RepID=A0A7R9ZIT6_9STRA|mmetsp:Transcript_11733/g.32363  ORF Transcript_11733/g.32363 Transcript_11733/m.32363 type:complete len:139 (+) Transcript_11733:259-675(+)